MATNTLEAKQLAHQLIDRLGPDQVEAVVGLLEVMVDDDGELTEADCVAIHRGVDHFAKGGQGIPFEQVVAELGFTMDQVRGK